LRRTLSSVDCNIFQHYTTDGTDEAAYSVAAGGDVVESSQFAHLTISEQQTATSCTAVPPFSRRTEAVVKNNLTSINLILEAGT
jgi:hypothetical protein